MKKAKRKSTRVGSSRVDMAATWKVLILFNMMLSIFGFWMIYSQNNYMMDAIQQKLPVAIPADYKGTSIVVNPFTGQFISVNSITLTGTFMGILVLVGTYFVLKEGL
jgi:hypothetical protein